MKNWIRKTLLLDKSIGMRVWIYSAFVAVVYFLILFNFYPDKTEDMVNFAIFAYGVGSLGLYVLIFGFDWSK